jgi:hypothetical protein
MPLIAFTVNGASIALPPPPTEPFVNLTITQDELGKVSIELQTNVTPKVMVNGVER